MIIISQLLVWSVFNSFSFAYYCIPIMPFSLILCIFFYTKSYRDSIPPSFFCHPFVTLQPRRLPFSQPPLHLLTCPTSALSSSLLSSTDLSFPQRGTPCRRREPLFWNDGSWLNSPVWKWPSDCWISWYTMRTITVPWKEDHLKLAKKCSLYFQTEAQGHAHRSEHTKTKSL